MLFFECATEPCDTAWVQLVVFMGLEDVSDESTLCPIMGRLTGGWALANAKNWTTKDGCLLFNIFQNSKSMQQIE